MIDFDLLDERNRLGKASIKVVGVGGAGGNTVNSMIEKGQNSEIEFIIANTDSQSLMLSKAAHKVQLGIKSTKGLGTGANPEVGRRAAEEDLDKLLEVIGNADIVFLAAGMGGGTGSGATPVIARALRERNILTIAVVTKPFLFEGRRRARVPYDAVKALRAEVDTFLFVPNERLLEISDQKVSMIDAFSLVNDVLDQSVRGIANIIIKPGHINVDFADLCTIMRDMGLAVMGTGKSSGEHRARQATMSAISSPLLENMSIKGAKGVLLNITGGKSLGLHEINEAASVIYNQADEDANIILGSVIDENMGDEIIVTIVATGFNENEVEISQEVVVQPKVQPQVQYVQAQPQPQPITEPVKPVHAAQPVVQPTVQTDVQLEAPVKKTVHVAPGIIVSAPIVTPLVQTKSQLTESIKPAHGASLDKLIVQEQALAQAAEAQDSLSAPQTDAQPVDVNDLDVPTFMRDKLKETQN